MHRWRHDGAPQRSWRADPLMKDPLAGRSCLKWRLLLQWGLIMMGLLMLRVEAHRMSRCMSHRCFWQEGLVARTFAIGSPARRSLTWKRGEAMCLHPFLWEHNWPPMAQPLLLLLAVL